MASLLDQNIDSQYLYKLILKGHIKIHYVSIQEHFQNASRYPSESVQGTAALYRSHPEATEKLNHIIQILDIRF